MLLERLEFDPDSLLFLQTKQATCSISRNEYLMVPVGDGRGLIR